ncbi:GNAT family N-acetyltransferase [Chengkuizengella sediminis]|uniref:GNAT family N-acetyltransferase n=1 Tax=Chengkuizengella sediminis TaxID=1885917 RepID=UPI00138A1A2F|nr:GNAT family N-acetyltransferase [Chengkuizengella sediminis]NDI35761.1 GNAT family N-acetyltransferase [Chengkuizengella sediminis]
MSVQLKEVNNENWEECVELKVLEEQNEYVPSNTYSIAQSKFENNMYLFAIYNDDCMVGFTSYILDDDGDMNLARFMIDKNYQGKGYGKLALKEVIELIKNNFDNKEVWMSIHPNNTTGMKLYIDAGFKITETGLESEDEVFLKLDF